MGAAKVKANSPILDGLVLWYDAIDNTADGHSASPANWHDKSGNGNHGALTGVTWLNNAAVFNGTTAKVVTPIKLPDTANFTVEICFVPTGLGNAQYLLTQHGTQNALRLSTNAANAIIIQSSGSTSYGGELTNNSRYCISIVRNGASNNVYLDNAKIIDRPIASITQDNNVVIGNYNASSTTNGFVGRILYVRVYNRALTKAERAHNYAYDIARYPAAA